MLKKILIIHFLLIAVFQTSRAQKTISDGGSLRSDYKELSRDDAKLMLKQKGLFDKFWNKAGDFNNEFESRSINRDKVVIDHSADLMWHPSGSLKLVNLEEAWQWIADLNKQRYAGFADWRLPTLEEAASLLENSRQKNLYINRAFDTRQWCIWTGDSLNSHLMWIVVFSGRIDWFDRNVRMNYVRPVRSLKP